MGVHVYLMRHGETEANVRQVLSGRDDSPFTEIGRRQPLEVARHLEALGLNCIYSSPMDRARRTAELVREALGGAIPVCTEPAIAEIDAGTFTGLSFEEIRRRAQTSGVRPGFQYPEGESWDDVQARAVSFVLRLEERHAGAAVLLVTHAGVICGLVAPCVGEPIDRFIRRRFGHDFLGRVRVEDGAIRGYQKLAGTVDSWY